ncbi:MAG TPA: nitroreductase family protein [Streptosporangiaceae bacterium]
MDFQDVVRRRRMVRVFTPGPVPQRSLDRILANSVRGPSAGFCQGQAFLVLTGDDLPRFWAIAGEATRPAVHTAPLIIIPLSCQRIYIDQYVRRDPSWADPSRWPMPWWHLDTAMAALLMLLTAVDEGLAAIFFGIVDHETRALRAEFGIPDDHQPIGAIAIGHDAETERADLASRRRPLAEMIHYGQW